MSSALVYVDECVWYLCEHTRRAYKASICRGEGRCWRYKSGAVHGSGRRRRGRAFARVTIPPVASLKLRPGISKQQLLLLSLFFSLIHPAISFQTPCTAFHQTSVTVYDTDDCSKTMRS